MTTVKRVPGAGQQKLQVALANMGNKQAKVGWFESAKYENGTQVATVAATHEFGTTKAGRNHTTVIPPRPYFRPTIAEKQAEWTGIAEQGAHAIMEGNATTYSVL